MAEQTPWDQVDPWLEKIAKRNAQADAKRVLRYYGLEPESRELFSAEDTPTARELEMESENDE
jgi:hypothetical protein